MWLYILLIVAYCSLFGTIIFLARREGSKSAKLAALKKEVADRAKEQAKANAILDNVRNMSNSDVRGRLRTISGKQR